jgi:selenocysteine lyase/cysteine desulfurase
MGGRARRFDTNGNRSGTLSRWTKYGSAEALEPMRPVVYDAGVLIAADRCERRIWAEHRVRLEAGVIPLVPSPVVAQASRSPKQVQMRRLLRGCEVIPFDEAAAHAAGSLLGKTCTKDVVDASVAVMSIRHGADVISDDAEDIHRLLSAARAKVSIIGV